MVAAKRKGFRRRIYKRDAIGRFARVGGNVARKRARLNVRRRKVVRGVNRSFVGTAARNIHGRTYGRGNRSPFHPAVQVNRPGNGRVSQRIKGKYVMTRYNSRRGRNAAGVLLRGWNTRREEGYAKRFVEFERRGGNTRGMRKPNLFLELDVIAAGQHGRKYRRTSRRSIISQAVQVHKTRAPQRKSNRVARKAVRRFQAETYRSVFEQGTRLTVPAHRMQRNSPRFDPSDYFPPMVRRAKPNQAARRYYNPIKIRKNSARLDAIRQHYNTASTSNPWLAQMRSQGVRRSTRPRWLGRHSL